VKQSVRKIVLSPYIDVFGAVLVFVVSIWRGFHLTFYKGGIITVDLHNQWSMLLQGAFPLGWLATVGAVFSLLSTRFVGKQSNSGNVIGVVTTVNSGAVDFFLGNRSALITYPITFLIHVFAVKKWSKGVLIRKIDIGYYVINFTGIAIGFALVWLGTWLFGGLDDTLSYFVISITFGLSLGANFCTALKYESTYFNWTIYNILQLLKAIILLNIANIAKYIFYLLNAIITFFDWMWNRDKNVER
jgi:nicotinamide mononucleotide transporter